MKGRTASTVHRPVDYEELAAVLATLHSVMARVEAILEDKPAAQRWLSTSDAAAIACVGSEQTVRNWCRRFQIGIRVRNVWQVDAVLLERLLNDRRR